MTSTLGAAVNFCLLCDAWALLYTINTHGSEILNQTQVSPGGSVANTLVAVARLSAANSGPPVRVSMAGSVGEDALGCYFNAQVGW